MKKYIPYGEYLYSRQFKWAKRIRWFFSLRRCHICWTRKGIQYHHLSYLVVGMLFEWVFLRPLCGTCHKRVQYILWFKLTKTVPLHIWYYVVKLSYWGTIGLVRVLLYIGKWVITSYAIPSRR